MYKKIEMKIGLGNQQTAALCMTRHRSMSLLRTIICSVGVMLACQSVHAADVTVQETRFDTAANFLAYTEFELSGEPLAEGLGLDLDVLHPDAHLHPMPFDYHAGIESYEYSESAMYALNYQSRMGTALLNGPRHRQRLAEGKTFAAQPALQQRIESFAQATGMPAAEIPQNLYLLSLPYASGSPALNLTKLDTRPVGAPQRIPVIDAHGKRQERTVVTPTYQQDFRTLNWNEKTFDYVINPAAMAGMLLKEVMWAQDFMGGMHDAETDEEVDAQSSTQDQHGGYKLGVSAADGFNGLVLTEQALDKLTWLQQGMGFDGQRLGVTIPTEYDPAKTPIWFPHKIVNSPVEENGGSALGKLSVEQAHSDLRDTWMLLWAVSEFFAFSDQRDGNPQPNLGFRAVFDGTPFANAPKHNTQVNDKGFSLASDGFSMSRNLSNLLFKNLNTLHFNANHKTLVDTYSPTAKSSATAVSVFDASYALVALSIYQRAQDALPVGYASGGDSQGLSTAQGQQALALIRAQADFLTQQAFNQQHLLVQSINLNSKHKTSVSTQGDLATQFAGVRGLLSAAQAMHSAQDAERATRYRQAARNLYLAIEQHLFDPKVNTWVEQKGRVTVHTPWTAAAISGGLRSVMLQLANTGEEKTAEPALSLKRLAQRYNAWFDGVINGGAQLAEMDTDTGEHMLLDGTNIDSDGDGVPSVRAGYAPVMAASVTVAPSP